MDGGNKMNGISEIEESAGVGSITYPYTGNSGYGRAIRDAEKTLGKIKVIRMEQISWVGTTIIFQLVHP